MSFKIKKENKIKETENQKKEKQYLISQIENIENSNLPFALLKLFINNNFIPLSIESYCEKIYPQIDSLRKEDGSKYSKNYKFAVKSALVANKLFTKNQNNLYGLNIKNAINYINKVKNKNNSVNKKPKNFLGKKRMITKNITLRKYEKYIHTFQILNDLNETFQKKDEETEGTKINFNKYKTTTDLMEKNMSLDKISGMLVMYKYFKNILKKFLYGKNMNIDYENKIKLNKQISGLKDGFDFVQSCIKNIINSKNLDPDN